MWGTGSCQEFPQGSTWSPRVPLVSEEAVQALVTSSNPGSMAYFLGKCIGLSLDFLIYEVGMVTLSILTGGEDQRRDKA